MNLTDNCKQQIIKVLERELDTRDKGYMFLKIQFPKLLPLIPFASTARGSAWAIYNEFEKQNMLGSLVACLNTTFDCSIYFEFEPDLLTKNPRHSCSNCQFFWYRSSDSSQPCPEYACMKGYWDSVSSQEEANTLYDENDCEDFILEEPKNNK